MLKTYLPKAPAFRETNDKNVKEIVERLFHPQELVRRSKMRHKKVPKQQVRKSEPYSEADIIVEKEQTVSYPDKLTFNDYEPLVYSGSIVFLMKITVRIYH
jgi:hypothetical protein